MNGVVIECQSLTREDRRFEHLDHNNGYGDSSHHKKFPADIAIDGIDNIYHLC